MSNDRKVSRRQFLRSLGIATGSAVLISCTPEVVKETVVVEKLVEKVVKETVVVEKAVEKVVEKVITATPEPVKKEPITLQFMGWMMAETFAVEKMGEIIAIFEAENPGIKVEQLGVQFYDMLQRATTMIGAGVPPDLWQSYIIWTPAWAQMGALEVLDKYIPSSWKTDMMNIKNGQVDGVQYAITHSPGPEAIFYNKTVFAQAGLDPEKPPTTWDEFVAIVEAASALPDVVGLAQTSMKEPSSFYWWLPWLWGFGGDLWDDKGNVILTDDAGMQWANWAKEWAEKEHMTSGIDGFTMRQVFGQNRAAFIMDGPWLKGILREISGKGEDFDKEWGMIVPVAGPGADQPWIATADHQLGMASQSAHKDEAWKFMEFLMREDAANKYYADLGMLPAMFSTFDDPAFADDMYIQTFTQASKYTRPFGFGADWLVVSDFWMQAVQEVMAGRDPAEAMASAKVSIETVVPPQSD